MKHRKTKFLYGLASRPAGLGAVPKDWLRLDPPLDGDGQPYTRHGVIVFNRPLSEQEITAFELVVIADDDLYEELVIEVALEMKEYAKGYVDMAESDFDHFCQSVMQLLRRLRKYRVYFGEYEFFCLMVKGRLEVFLSNSLSHNTQYAAV